MRIRYTKQWKDVFSFVLTVLVLYHISSARLCILLHTSINKSKNRKKIHWERLERTIIKKNTTFFYCYFLLAHCKRITVVQTWTITQSRGTPNSSHTLTLHGHNTIKLFAKFLEVFGRWWKCYTIKTTIWIWKLLNLSELDWNFLWAGPSSSQDLDKVFQGNPWKNVSIINILVLIFTNQLLNKFTSI